MSESLLSCLVNVTFNSTDDTFELVPLRVRDGACSNLVLESCE